MAAESKAKACSLLGSGSPCRRRSRGYLLLFLLPPLLLGRCHLLLPFKAKPEDKPPATTDGGRPRDLGSFSEAAREDLPRDNESGVLVDGDASPANQAPQAQDDQATASFNTAVDIAVLANDTDPEGDTLVVKSVGPAANKGMATINANQLTVHYLPPKNYGGKDIFTYRVSDGKGGEDEGQVTVTIASGAVVPGSWVKIPAGSFLRGSPVSEPCRELDVEDPQQVTLSFGLEITNTEVTQGLFHKAMGYNPSYFTSCGLDCPVERVNWHEAAAYCNGLSQKQGLSLCYSCSGEKNSVSCQTVSAYSGKNFYQCPGFRLPTEAEWEYAYRAGTSSAYYSGANDTSACSGCSKMDEALDQIGWYLGNSSANYSGCEHSLTDYACGCLGTHPVAQKTPNPWGLYDMAGNVFEWCQDLYQKSLGPSAVTDPVGLSGV
jgi:formylglycine-generating enzyme required for sulfatase activity